MEPSTLLIALAYLLIIVGVIGSLLPVIPGPLLIWLGALLWAWADGFQAVGWPTLVVLGLLVVLIWSSDVDLTTVGSRKAGASWKAVGGAIAGGITGSILLSGVVPIIGTLVGALLGAVLGMVLIEYYDKRDWGRAIQATKGYIFGSVAARILEFFLSLLMATIFAWQAFL